MTAHDFSRVSTWAGPEAPPGMAHGWHGHAWVWLHLVLSGLAGVRRPTCDAIGRRLSERTQGSSQDGSHLYGTGGRPVVAALAALVDDRLVGTAEAAIEDWASERRSQAEGDVMRGTAGMLLAAAEIEACLPSRIPRGVVSRLQHRCAGHLQQQLAGVDGREGVYLGLAHGLVGSLFALESARVAFGLSPIGSLRRRVLAALEATRIRVPGHRGGFWPVTSSDRRLTVHGWCHGGPGIALGLLGCLALTRRPDYRHLARQALAGIAAVCRADSTCCGRLGQIQILIEAARILDDDRWLEEASRMARPLAAPSRRRHDSGLASSLWKGLPGHDFLAWRLAHPRSIPFPGLGRLSHRQPGGHP